MATKVKTTVTFTFEFTSDSEVSAISSLRSWFSERLDREVQLMQDTDTEDYTYLDTESSMGKTFRFKTPAEFIEKYSKAVGYYAPAGAMLDFARQAGVTATVETIEVEEAK